MEDGTTLIPVVDLRAQYNTIREELLTELQEVADSLTFILGPKVAAFERQFAEYLGVKHCIGVNSGTSALHLALIATGVGEGDEVITVPMTFISTSWAISYVGATPVYVDIDKFTYTMDVNQVEQRITERTKAILPVHLYGHPCDMEPLMALGRRYGIPIIEDAAHAHGAKYQGRTVGTFGVVSAFSFYPGKNLGGCGEAGAVVTNDDAIAERVYALRDHAQRTRYHSEEIGYNYRMDAFQGAVLAVKLKYIDRWTELRRERAAYYQKRLAELPLKLPEAVGDVRHVWHQFVVLHPHRDGVRPLLEAHDVATALHYPIPTHLQKAYRHLEYRCGDFPVAEGVASNCMSLPLFPEMTERQQEQVIDALERVLPLFEEAKCIK